MFQLVPLVHETKARTNNMLDSSILCQLLDNPGPLLHWILSLVCLFLKVILSFLPLDRFSNAAHFVPLAKLPTAFETAQLLVSNIIHLHEIPLDIVSYSETQFVSQVWKAFCNGQTERCNQEMESTLRCIINNNPTSWCKYLPWVEYAHNSYFLCYWFFTFQGLSWL